MDVMQARSARAENGKHGVVMKLDASAKITRHQTGMEWQKPGVALH
jgi:hypothetical protein